MHQTIHPKQVPGQHPAVIAMRARLESAEARIAELEGGLSRMREAADHPHLNSIERLTST